jgi:hypothetical protein
MVMRLQKKYTVDLIIVGENSTREKIILHKRIEKSAACVGNDLQIGSALTVIHQMMLDYSTELLFKFQALPLSTTAAFLSSAARIETIPIEFSSHFPLSTSIFFKQSKKVLEIF